MSSDNTPHAPDLALPLCVDLDGTLVKTDTLVDSVLVLGRQHPRAILSIPGWLARGKAAFKQHVTEAVSIDVAALPYNKPLLDFLFHQHAAGRPLYLVTAADRTLADRIAAHHVIFSDVLASTARITWPAATNSPRCRRASDPTSPTSAMPGLTCPS